MKPFIIKILRLSIPILIYSLIASIAAPRLISLVHGPSTREKISFSFENALNRDYELLILGNSRLYRGLNPDKFSYDVYNFSHDNDSYNQIFFKLKYLIERNKSIKHLILGTDYFQFSFLETSRNYIYGDYFGEDYLKDFPNNRNLSQEKVINFLSNINPKKLLRSPPLWKPFMRENGQYIRHAIAMEDGHVKRKINRLDIQVTYFQKTLEFCKSQNIIVFIVMPPVRSIELMSYTIQEIDEFNSFIDNYLVKNNVFYLNYSTVTDFKTEDYTDITHLSESGADRFSGILDNDLNKLIKMD